MNKALLRQLVCPYTGANLVWRSAENELWCSASKLAYPVVEGVPVMIIERARALSEQECELL